MGAGVGLWIRVCWCVEVQVNGNGAPLGNGMGNKPGGMAQGLDPIP